MNFKIDEIVACAEGIGKIDKIDSPQRIKVIFISPVNLEGTSDYYAFDELSHVFITSESSKNKTLTMPHFEARAKYIENTFAAVALALKQAFDQGRALGFREGQEHEAGAWWRDQDQSLRSIDEN